MLSNLPPKGTSDWAPREFALKKHIFDTWRAVCQKYNYQEYLTPILEHSEIYKAKSGEDIGGKELLIITDRAGRELSIRPEMTPSVTRLVTRLYDESPKPIRLFSIANFWRNERPQRGRSREFWQLNYDVFGTSSLQADLEILTLSIELMLAFNPPRHSFTFNLNHRHLINGLLAALNLSDSVTVEAVRIMDKVGKFPREEITKRFGELGLTATQIDSIFNFLEAQSIDELLQKIPSLQENTGLTELRALMDSLQKLGYGDLIAFRPNLIRGFDYYDGMVFEAFDNHPDNNRSLFGGGRYNGLAGIFGKNSFPAVGAAPGEVPFTLFLESWNLADQAYQTKSEVIFLPLLNLNLLEQYQSLAQKLRSEGKMIELGMDEMKLKKALEYANKKSFASMIILDDQEASAGHYVLKNMQSGDQQTIKL